MSIRNPVQVRREPVVLPTYEPRWPDRNPMFLEKRVYQGSSGRVYPLPFVDRIAERSRPCTWDAVFIENDFLRVMILPALGGRIHRVQDKTNGYDLVYYQPVVKPALVGLAGPWASGGIEFNWPQHHRPSTFMPADVAIERHADGSATVWLSEHDPMARMKGMHGVRLHPARSYLELVVRVYNRTADVQTFLWWANVAIRVHEHYQSFFPPDATHVADHAKRATSAFPLCQDRYYGVDYAGRARSGVPAGEQPSQFPPRHRDHGDGGPVYAPNDLSWYANIPVPTSYMCMGSDADFAGGYDHRARAGLVHVANHHIAPGKKQWTWGNHDFGYAWDRNLTDPDATGEYPPYIELMSGVYTENQPDFSFLQPGETKTWSQFWYPLRDLGPVQQANVDAAASLHIAAGKARLGVLVTAPHRRALIRLTARDRVLGKWQQDLTPAAPVVREVVLPQGTRETDVTLTVLTGKGATLLTYTPAPARKATVPPAATEPPAPARVTSNDELFFIGCHLEQYRHATRPAESYWREAVRRDPGDARCLLALGRWHLRRGEFTAAETRLRASIARQTSRNPNPYDGEAYYQLGQCLRLQAFAAGIDAPAAPASANNAASAAHRTPRTARGRAAANAASLTARSEALSAARQKMADAYAAFYKSTWNQAWQSAAFHALAEIDAWRGDWAAALDHLDRSLRLNTDNLRARALKAIALRQLGQPAAAASLLQETLTLDPLDWWARYLAGEPLRCDAQVRLDLALDCARAGLFRDALAILRDATSAAASPGNASHAHLPDASLGTEPLVHYYRAWLHRRLGDTAAQALELAAAEKANPDHCFPARLEEIAILTEALMASKRPARAAFLLGNLLYDRRRHEEAIALWQRAVRFEPRNAVAWRNLGIGCFNVRHDPAAARRAYARACAVRPRDARLLFERDQLQKRLGEPPAKRLRQLLRHLPLVRQRDDLTVELCALFNQTGAPARALEWLQSRRFQPWEGGEGQALGQYVRTRLALGRLASKQRDFSAAIAHFSAALEPPANLGETRHLLANASDIHYELGGALAAAGRDDEARHHWTLAAEARGDFQAMSMRTYSEMTYFSALAARRLGRTQAAAAMLRGLLAHARRLARTPAEIDYFATSLPTMLLFDDDLTARQRTTALFLQAQARLGLGQRAAARRLKAEVLRRDPNHPLAADLPV